MMRHVGGVRKPIHQSWLAKGLGLGLLCWDFKGVQKEIPSEEANTLQIGSVAFPPGQLPVNNSILVTDYLTKMGIKIVPHPPYSPDHGPCDFWLFPKLISCRYETNERGCDEGHWHTHTRRLPWGLPEVVGMVQGHCSLKGTRVSCVYYQYKCLYKKSLETYLMILVYIYIYIYIYMYKLNLTLNKV